MKSIEQLIEENSIRAGDCILWTGGTTDRGYAVLGGLSMYRAAWTAVHGEPKPGLVVCHRCDNKNCVNVEHLFLGTHRDNSDDMMNKGRNTRQPQARPPAPSGYPGHYPEVSKLIHGLGLTLFEVYEKLDRIVTLSIVDSWFRAAGRPGDLYRVFVAEKLGIPVNDLLRACVGLPPDPNDRAHLTALTADETPVELCYHPDADDGSGNGWSLMVGDRTVAAGTLDKVLNAS